MKKIIVLNGSPRKKGNTAALISAFTKGAEEAGHTVTTFNLQEMDIHPCIGCFQGGKDIKSPCTQKDDMDKIYPVYEEADIFVMASPLYYWSFSAQLKMAIDRLFAISEAYKRKRPPKDCMMIIAAEGSSQNNFKPMIDYYEALLSHMGWKDLGMVFGGGVQMPGDIEGKPSLEEARKLGASIK